MTEPKRFRLRDVVVKRIALVATAASGHRFHLLAKAGGTALAPLAVDPTWSTAYVVVAAPGHQEDGGILAAPGTSDEWDPDAIREACHQATIEGAPITAGHFTDEAVGHVAESYVAPADFQVGDTSIVKGSWVLGVRPTVEGRRLIESGEASGVSIEGEGTREAMAKEDLEERELVEGLMVAMLAKALSSKQLPARNVVARKPRGDAITQAIRAVAASERKAKPAAGKPVADRLYRKLTALGVKPALARKLADDPAARKVATGKVGAQTTAAGDRHFLAHGSKVALGKAAGVKEQHRFTHGWIPIAGVDITATDKSITVTSPFDKAFVAGARRLDGRFNPKSKSWRVPRTNEKALADLLDKTYRSAPAAHTISDAELPAGVTIRNVRGSVLVAAPFNRQFITDAKAKGARWQPATKEWAFPPGREADARSLAARHYKAQVAAKRAPTSSSHASHRQIHYALSLLSRHDEPLIQDAFDKPSHSQVLAMSSREVSGLIAALKEDL